SNVTFAGAERDQLFITASKAIYSIKMQVKGGERKEEKKAEEPKEKTD
ncbi:MAG: hypothetical protein GXY61_02170, partial [Lentisphaerae bacterium]|nr:hypothetical protein [Lentisphaerota bacterium]